MFPILPIAAVGLGLFQTYQNYQAGQAEADALRDQARLDREQAARQMELDSQKDADEVNLMRDKARRNRAAMEAAYAASGVLLEGSAAQVLTSQRETDELNAQRSHRTTNEQLKLDNWGANERYKQMMYRADTADRMADISVISGLAGTATSAFSAWQWGSQLNPAQTITKSKPTGFSNMATGGPASPLTFGKAFA